MGFTDQDEEGNFILIGENDRNSSFVKWSIKEPNNADLNEDCGILYENGLWNDGNCNGKVPGFICQIPVSEYM